MTMEQHSNAPTPSQNVTCHRSAMNELTQRTAGIKSQVLRADVLMLGNAILAGILIGIGTYGTRYRHRAFVRALFQGATTLFLPILSYVVSSASGTVSTFPQTTPVYLSGSEIAFDIACNASTHLFTDLIWAGLVNIVGIITCTMVAATDREGRNIGLPMALLAQGIWSCYLVVSLTPQMQEGASFGYLYRLLHTIFALFFVKMSLRYYAFLKARRSVALGHNPPLIVGYVEQLHKGSKYCIPPTVEHCPPPLVVMGEHKHDVEKVPHGFFFKRLHHNQDDMTTMSNCSGLVTVDKIWRSDDKILTSAPRLKDVCLSFSLFKLLRCRFAGYTVAEAGFQNAYNFFLHVLLKDNDHERVYGVITDELSFLHDYYYSSIPIHYSNFWLPILNIFVSLLTIIYCLLLALLGTPKFILAMTSNEDNRAQVSCWITYYTDASYEEEYSDQGWLYFGNMAFDVVPVAILIVLVVLAEAREIATYICSNWTKVGLICSYAVSNHDKWQGWIGRVVTWRSKLLMKHWDDKMNQCSVLVLHPRRSDPIVSLISRFLHLPDRKRNVKVPREVKAAIVDALRSINNDGFLVDPATFLRQSLEDRGGGNFVWASNGEGIADIILMWHIATDILGLRRCQHQQQPPSGNMIVATHLSRYCAYSVEYVPELLPDYDKWSNGLYMAVKEDSMRALAGSGRAALPATESVYDKLVSLLQERAKNKVLTNGVKLAKELEQEGEEAAWRLLAGFWSLMILYVAPSEKLNGHADAIARGGELITFVWALLMHAGIAGRPATGERV